MTPTDRERDLTRGEVEDRLITIVGSSHFHAITALVDNLRRLPQATSSSEISTPGHENGLAAAVCLLAVVSFESFMVRAWYIKGRTDKAKNGLDAFRKLYPDNEHIEYVTEAFVLRDLIAHNHLWELTYTWGDDEPIMLRKALPLSGGDNKYLEVVDIDRRRTRALNLHVLPNRVDRYDAAMVLDVIYSALEYCDADNHTACPIKDSWVRLSGRSVRFGDFVAGFRNEILLR